jgi:hypothetical protein
VELRYFGGLSVEETADFLHISGWHELYAGHENKAFEATRQALAFDPDHGWPC